MTHRGTLAKGTRYTAPTVVTLGPFHENTRGKTGSLTDGIHIQKVGGGPSITRTSA